MKLDLFRKYRKSAYTIGHLSINGVYVCDTMEDRDRGLTSTMSEGDIINHKVKGQTAIPTGEYKVIMAKSSSLHKVTPRICNVPGFDGILIHAGNTAADTKGCILCGKNTEKGKVTKSTYYTQIVYNNIEQALAAGEKVTIEIHW